MLTLKSPIQLQSGKPILTFSDRLSHKIIGNYQLMHLSITAQDLLHMTVQEPEIYLATSQEQITVINHHEIYKNKEKLEVMNQFFNRIMLLHTSEFTYQDEVFVTTVLQKLGITDVASFITQLQEAMDYHTLLQTLVTKYFEQGDQIETALTLFMEQHKNIIKENTVIDRQVLNQLHNIVFTHLNTAEAINTVYDYQKKPFETSYITREQAKLLPQLKQADEIHLTGLRHYILQQNQSITYMEQNQYEQKILTKEDVTQQKVMQYLVAVILSNLAQNMTYEVKENTMSMTNWMDFTQIFYDTSLDAIQRFEENQLENYNNQIDMHFYTNYRKQLYEDEVTLLEILQKLQHNEMLFQVTTQDVTLKQNTLLALLENQNLQQQLEESLHYYTSQIQNEMNLEQNQQEYQILKMLQKQADSYRTLQKYYLDQKRQNIENKQQEINMETMQENNRQYVEASYVQDEQYETVQEYENQEISKLELQHNETAYSLQNQDEYITYLWEMNEKNIAMQKLLAQQSIMVDHTKKVIINKKLAKEKALKALENPQEVLQEIYQSATGIETSIPQKIERYLRYTDDKTRRLYEKILGIATKEEYQEDMQVIETDAETVQHAVTELMSEPEITNIQNHRTINAFYENVEEMRNSLQKVIENQKQIDIQETISLQKCLPIKDILPVLMDEKKETMSLIQAPIQKLEQEISTAGVLKEEPKIEKTVQLIHQHKEEIKQEMIEDVVHKLQINTNTSTQEVYNEQTEQEITKQIQKTKKEIISENEEIIEKMLQSTMQTQLHVLSDQVYQDIEKRLQSERRRRGY